MNKRVGYMLNLKSMFKNLTIVFISSIFCGYAFCGQGLEEPDLIFAKKAFSDRFYELAASRLEVFLRNYPHASGSYEAHALLGRCYYHQDRFQRALSEFDLVMNMPEAGRFHDAAVYWAAETHIKNENFKKALELHQKIIDEFSYSKYLGYAIYSKGWLYYKLGFLSDAVKCFRDVVLRYPLEKVAMESQFKIAECEYLLKRYDAAAEELKTFIEKFPISEKTADAYYLNGEAYFSQGKYNDAAVSFRRAISISKGAKWMPLASYRIARCLFYLGDYDNSVKEFKRCIEFTVEPFLTSLALLGMAQDYEKMGLKEEVKRVSDLIIQRYPKTDVAMEAYYYKAKLSYNQRDLKVTENICKDGLERSSKPEYTDGLHYLLGSVYFDQDRFQESLDEFRWIEKESNDVSLGASALCKVADIYFIQKDYKNAAWKYDMVLNEYPESRLFDYAQYQIGNIFSLTDRYDQAILAYQAVLTDYPKTKLSKNLLYQLGAAYFKKDDFENAALVLKRLLEEFPASEMSLSARLYLAQSYYNMNNYEEALALFKEEALEGTDISKMTARYGIGLCYYSLHREEEALGEFNKFLKDYPQSPLAEDAEFWLAGYWRSKGAYDKAVEQFRFVLKTFPSEDITKESLYELAATLEDDGKKDEAVARFEEFLSGFPNDDRDKTIYRKIAKLKKGTGDFDSAIKYLKRSIGDGDNELNAQIQYEVAECLEEKGDLQMAAEEYLKVSQLYPKGTFWSIKGLLESAKIFEGLQSISQAKKIYEELGDMNVEESKFAKKRLEELKNK